MGEGDGGGEDKLGLIIALVKRKAGGFLGSTYPAFIQRVDKRDESSCQIAAFVVHSRHVRHNEGLILLAQLEIVRRARRTPDNLVKGEPRALPTRLGDHDIAAPDLMGRRMGRIMVEVAQEAEPALRVRFGARVEGVVVDARRRAGDLAVVCLRVEVQDGEAALEQVDTWDEGFTLDAVFVQVVRVPVAGRDDDGAVRHQGFHEAAQNHGVGDVGALKLVEAEDRGTLGDVGGYVGDRVDVVAVGHFHLV